MKLKDDYQIIASAVVKQECRAALGDILFRRHFDAVNTLAEETITFNAERDYLQGLADGGVSGAYEFLNLLRKHEKLRLRIEKKPPTGDSGDQTA